ncbi:MAG: GNAT family N-acetyltransferase [Chloroflexi bacterium]|nr:GNAT family N-acetyltransferase [Chloroflexota bacterium]MQC25439.1 N-acetyltransferase [Chloroflexota bacterium]MQC48544.1 N-acetyltransferase [Chloroflexota bacterium]
MTATRPVIIGEGRLIRLRVKTVEDAERDYAWRCDPELARYDAARPLTVRFPNFLATLREELQYPTIHRRTFAIDDPATDRHIGNVMYYGYDAFAQEAELGITIGDRDYWGNGYGTDAVRTMLRYLFDDLRLRRVYLHTLSWNYRAQAAFQRAGFKPVRPVSRGGYDFIYMEAYPGDEVEQAAQ